MTDIKDLNALVLCGGLGTRLREVVKDVPKPMAPVGGIPFLDFVLDYLGGFGIKKIILASGYKAGVIRSYYERNPRGFEIYFSEEKEPLGTAGAVAAAKDIIKGNPFFVLNGDSICRADLASMLEFHLERNALATAALAAAPDGARDYGSVILSAEGLVKSFHEKSAGSGSAFVNAGIYVFDRKIFDFIPRARASSLERDVFPSVKNIFGYISGAELSDIGTKERFLAARKNLAPRDK